MESIFRLGILLRVMDMVSGPVQAISSSIDGLASRAERLQPVFDRFKDYGRWIAGAGIAGALGLGVAVTQFANLEEAQLRLRTTVMDVTGAVGPEYERLNALAEKLGTDLPGSTKDMVQMFSALREQGSQVGQILGGMGTAAAQFAALMKLGFAESAVHVSKFSHSMGLADSEIVPFMDLLQRLKYSSGVEINELAYTFKFAGGSLKMLGLQGLESAKDFSAIVGMLARAGMEGSTAGTNLSQAFSRMAEIGHRLDRGQVKKLVGPILDKYHVKLDFFTSAGEFRGLRPMISELEKLKALNPQEQIITLKKLFGDEAARPLAILLKGGIAGFDEMLQRMRDQADMQTKNTEIMSGSKMQWETLTGTVANLVAHVGGVVTRIAGLVGIMKVVNDLAGRLDAWVLANPTTAGIVAALAVALTATALAAGGMLLAIGLGGTLFLKITVGAQMFNAALNILQLGCTGLIGRLTVLATTANWAWIVTATSGFRTLATAINVGAVPALVSLTKAFWGLAVAVVSNPLFWIPAAIALVVAGLVWLYNHSVNVRAGFQSMAYAIGFAVGFMVKGWRAMLGLVQAMADNVTQALGSIFNALPRIGAVLGELFMGIFNYVIAPVFSAIWRAGGKMISTLCDGMASQLHKPKEMLKEAFSMLRNLLPFSDAKEGPLSQLTLSGARIMTTLGAGIVGAAPELRRTLSAALAGAVPALSLKMEMPSVNFTDLYDSGQKIIATLCDGMGSLVGRPKEMLYGAFSMLRNLLPFSDAKEGPLSQLTLSGSRIMTTLGAGIVGSAPGLHRTMSAALAGAALTTALTVETPVISDAPALAARQAAIAGSGSGERRIVIQIGKVELPGVSNANDFVAWMQAFAEGHDV